MKNRALLLGICIACFFAVQISAQTPGPEFSAFRSILESNTAFSASLTLTTEGSSATAPLTIVSKSFRSGSKRRSEFDAAALPCFDSRPITQLLSTSGQSTEIVVIDNPARKSSYTVFPALRAYIVQPLTSSGDIIMPVSIARLGSDQLHGHPCSKNSFIFTDASAHHEFTVWQAADLNSFPIRFETVRNGVKMVGTFSELTLAAPDPKLFEPPFGFSAFTSFEALHWAAQKRLIHAGSRKK
jgi:hypothetical protein